MDTLDTLGKRNPGEQKEESTSQERSVDQFFDEVPENIPGAVSVDKARVESAKYCLVHIRQEHLSPREKLSRSQKDIEDDEKLKSLREIQADIHLILTHLTAKLGVKDVYLEAVSQGFEEKIESIFALQKECEESLRVLRRREKELKDQLRDLQTTMDKLPESKEGQELRMQYRTERHGLYAKLFLLSEDVKKREETLKDSTAFLDSGLLAVRDFVKRGKVRLRGAEDPTLNEKAVTTMEPKAVFEEREDMLLKMIQENNTPIAVTVFGGDHQWKDNVEKWNREHPQDQFSLIVVTPRAYRKYWKLLEP